MNDKFNPHLGIDLTYEIFNLWFEVAHLRIILSHIVTENPNLLACLNEEVFSKSKKQAQEILKNRFPNHGIKFEKKITNP